MPPTLSPTQTPSLLPTVSPTVAPTRAPTTFAPTFTAAPTGQSDALKQRFSFIGGAVQYFKVPYDVPDQSVVLVEIHGAQGGHGTGEGRRDVT